MPRPNAVSGWSLPARKARPPWRRPCAPSWRRSHGHPRSSTGSTAGPLVDDLQLQRRAIVDTVAPTRSGRGLDLMWRFLALAGSVFARCDDSSGTVIGVFDAAVSDLGQIAHAATPDPTTLADRTFRALPDNGHGQYDTLIQVLTPTLGPEGLEHLKQRMLAWSNVPARTPPDQDRRVLGYGSSGPIDADDLAERSRTSTVRLALMQIADAQGDVDAFIAQYDAPTRQVPNIAAQITLRLCAAGRAKEALQVIDAADRRGDRGEWPTFEWEDARIEVLDTLTRGDQAQADRWSCFERALSTPHLRASLKRLPDFEDVDAEERALDYAEGPRSRHTRRRGGTATADGHARDGSSSATRGGASVRATSRSHGAPSRTSRTSSPMPEAVGVGAGERTARRLG